METRNKIVDRILSSNSCCNSRRATNQCLKRANKAAKRARRRARYNLEEK